MQYNYNMITIIIYPSSSKDKKEWCLCIMSPWDSASRFWLPKQSGLFARSFPVTNLLHWMQHHDNWTIGSSECIVMCFTSFPLSKKLFFWFLPQWTSHALAIIPMLLTRWCWFPYFWKQNRADYDNVLLQFWCFCHRCCMQCKQSSLQYCYSSLQSL